MSSVGIVGFYGGTFSCTYDLSRTLSGLRKGFQNLEVSDGEIAAFAESQNIPFDEAMQRAAFYSLWMNSSTLLPGLVKTTYVLSLAAFVTLSG